MGIAYRIGEKICWETDGCWGMGVSYSLLPMVLTHPGASRELRKSCDSKLLNHLQRRRDRLESAFWDSKNTWQRCERINKIIREIDRRLDNAANNTKQAAK